MTNKSSYEALLDVLGEGDTTKLGYILKESIRDYFINQLKYWTVSIDNQIKLVIENDYPLINDYKFKNSIIITIANTISIKLSSHVLKWDDTIQSLDEYCNEHWGEWSTVKIVNTILTVNFIKGEITNTKNVGQLFEIEPINLYSESPIETLLNQITNYFERIKQWAQPN